MGLGDIQQSKQNMLTTINRVLDIHTYYELNHILFDVSLEVKEGQVACLLGPNGAGKAMTLKSIIGLLSPRKGKVIYKDEDITGIQPYILARKGIGYVPIDRRIFADLSVKDNLEIAARKRAGRVERKVYFETE